MSIRKLVKILIFLAVFAMAIRISIGADTWWHIKTGEYILQNMEIPQTDIFSHTQYGETWRGASVGWLMQTVMYLIYSNFGFGGLNIFTASMVTFAFYIIYRTMSGGVFLRGFIIIFAATASSIFWSTRPYLMSFVLTALCILIFEDFRWNRKNRLWALPLIMILWVNSHGGFVYGLIIWGLYGLAEGIEWIGKADKYKNIIPKIFNKEWLLLGFKGKVGKFLLIGTLMVIAVCVNPAGPEMLLYPFETVSITTLQDFIQEWQSPNFHLINVQPFAWLILSMIATLGLSKKKLVLSDFILLSTFLYMSLLAGRNIAIFCLVSVPILSRYAAPLTKILGEKFNYSGLSNLKSKPPFNLINASILIMLTSVVLLKTLLVTSTEINQDYIETIYPTKAIQFLKDNPQNGNMLNTYNWGGYLIWALPEYPVFVDGRTDLYGDKILKEWISLMKADVGWEKKLDKWQIEFVILEPDMYLVRELQYANWSLIYEDELAVIIKR